MYTMYEDGWGVWRATVRIGWVSINVLPSDCRIDIECRAFNILMAACQTD